MGRTAGARECAMGGTTASAADQAEQGRWAHAFWFWQRSQLAALCHTCHRKHVGFLLIKCANYFHILL